MYTVKNIVTISNITGALMLAALTMASCAKISAPSGGPKDTVPPVILESQPENATKRFSSKSFTVTFDEYIALDKINENFMVSPPIGKKPEISIKGKSLVVKWEEELADSTTYTFYFQDAIRDNNEGNIFSNYSYCFSTGDVLDSLSLTGNVFNSDNLEGPSDIFVMMYSNLSDTAPSKMLPSYISKPDFSGGFTIRNIKPGHYRLYALNDMNGNKLFDGGEEKFAFMDSVINITAEEYYGVKLDSIERTPKAQEKGKGGKATSVKTKVKPEIYTFGQYKMFLFAGEPKKQYLTSSERESAGSLMFTLALPADTSAFDFSLPGISDTTWFMQPNSTRDTFRIWITDKTVYETDLLEALIRFPYTDSTDALIYKSDTVKMIFLTRAPTSRTAKAKMPSLKLEENINNAIRPGTQIWFKGESPLNIPDTSKMDFVQTVDTVRTILKPVFVRDEKDSRKIFLKAQLTPGATYTLICREAAFSDIFNIKNDSIAYKFKVNTAEEYGRVIANLTGFDGSAIVQILNEKEVIINQKIIKSPGKAVFELLDKGKYRLKVIYDLDNNGRYSTGDFYNKRQPEPVSYYPGELEVMVNWELEQDWDISKVNSKELVLRGKTESKTGNR